MLSNKFFPYSSMQEINLDWILTKVKNLMRFLPDDGSVGQILRRTAHGAEWSNEQGGGGAVTSVNGQTGDVVLAIPDSTSDLINDSGFVDAAGAAAAAPVQKVNGQTGTVTINKTGVGLGNVANVLQYSASNPPPYPVTSVNSQTGAVVLSIPTDTSDLNNDSGFVDAAGAAAAAPVQSVNGQTGAVTVPGTTLTVGSWTPTGGTAVSDRCQYAKTGKLLIIYMHFTITNALANGQELQFLPNLETALDCEVNPATLISATAYAYGIGLTRLFYNANNGGLWLSNTSGANYPAGTGIYGTFIMTIN